MKENKELIAKHMYELLKQTRFGNNLRDVRYIPIVNMASQLEKEILSIEWDNGYTETINVTADSGLAMIIDLAKWLKTK